MNDKSIVVEGIGKRFRIGSTRERYRTLRDTLSSLAQRPSRTRTPQTLPAATVFGEENHVWALRDISFTTRQGEVLGIIGHNGAGKSTLLKILSRITEPTEGEAYLRGRVGSLLEVGTGFHPELSGRENVYLNGAIIGMRRSEIEQRFEEIVSFADISQFLDTPVKRYSTGMYLRLAFAVAAHLDPEILLIDEVLAVGDSKFQAKCLEKMASLSSMGRTLLLVSHNLAFVRRLATRLIWLENGRVNLDGDTNEVISEYASQAAQSAHIGIPLSLERHQSRTTNSTPTLRQVTLESNESINGALPLGASLSVTVSFNSDHELKTPYIGLGIDDPEGTRIYSTNTVMGNGEVPRRQQSGTYVCHLGKLPLNQGTYWLTIELKAAERPLDRIERACSFQVLPCDGLRPGSSTRVHRGHLYWPSAWEFRSQAGSETTRRHLFSELSETGDDGLTVRTNGTSRADNVS